MAKSDKGEGQHNLPDAQFKKWLCWPPEPTAAEMGRWGKVLSSSFPVVFISNYNRVYILEKYKP
jgi:hypothetical protein